MGQRHSETHNKGKLKYGDIIDSREDFNYSKIKYEVISTYILKGISCQSINYTTEGGEISNLGEISKETTHISLSGLELKESVSSFGIYEAVNEAFETCKISRPKKLLVYICKDDDKLCDIHLELQYLQQLALIETKFDDLMRSVDKSQPLNKEKPVEFILYKNPPQQKEENSFAFLLKKNPPPRQEKRPKGYDLDGNAFYASSKQKAQKEYKYIKIKSDVDSKAEGKDQNQVILDSRDLKNKIEIKDEKFTENSTIQSHSQYSVKNLKRESSNNKFTNSWDDHRFSSKNTSYDNVPYTNTFYESPSHNEHNYGSDYLSSSAIKEISANPRFKIYAKTPKPLLGFFYDTYDYSDDSEFASYFLIGLDSTIHDQDILNYFENHLKFKVREIIRNPLEEESIVRLVLFKDQSLINSHLGNKKLNTKLMLCGKNVMIVEIPHKRKFHPEDFYKNYQIALELERPIQNYESLFKLIEKKIGEILEIRFYQPLKAIITCLDKNSEKNAKADVHFSYSDSRNGYDDQHITFLDCINKKPISGNKIEISFKYKNQKNEQELNYIEHHKNYIESDLKWPKRPPLAYNFRNTYIPSFYHLFRNCKMWKDFKISNGCNNYLSVEEFINWYENNPHEWKESKNVQVEESYEYDDIKDLSEKRRFSRDPSPDKNIINQNNFFSKKNISDFQNNKNNTDYNQEQNEEKNYQDNIYEKSQNFELDLNYDFEPYKPGEVIDLDNEESIQAIDTGKKKIRVEDYEDLIPGKLSAAKKIDDLIYETKQKLSNSKKDSANPTNSEKYSEFTKNSNDYKEKRKFSRERSNSKSSKSHSISNCSVDKMLSRKRINDEKLENSIKNDLKPKRNFVKDDKASPVKNFREYMDNKQSIKNKDFPYEEIISRPKTEEVKRNITKSSVTIIKNKEFQTQDQVESTQNHINKIKQSNHNTTEPRLSNPNFISLEEYNKLGDEFLIDLSEENSNLKNYEDQVKNKDYHLKEKIENLMNEDNQTIISHEDSKEFEEEYFDINAI
jgi:hypothetical protein